MLLLISRGHRLYLCLLLNNLFLHVDLLLHLLYLTHELSDFLMQLLILLLHLVVLIDQFLIFISNINSLSRLKSCILDLKRLESL